MSAMSVVAQDEKVNTFTIDASLMTRGELRRGGLPENDEGNSEGKAAFILARTRLGVSYERPIISARITAQHNGVWGQSGKGSFNLYEAWAQLTARNGMFARVGRQVLSYDDERIIGSNDWAMAAMYHDLLKFGIEREQHRLHVFAAYNQNAVSVNGGTKYVNGDKPYKTMQGAWYHYAPSKVPIGISLLFMNTGMQGADDSEDDVDRTYQQQLFGTYVRYAPRRWSVEGSFYYQTGKNEYKAPIRAWMMSYKGEYKPSRQWALCVGYDYLSGDKKFAVPPGGGLGLIRHDVIRGFSPVYGSHHKFYGAMDFFYLSTYINGFTPGLQNLYCGVSYQPIERLTLDGAYHYFATATSLEDKGLNRTLGHEMELQVGFQIIKEVKVSAGYTYMHGSKTMEHLKRVDTDRNLHWAWLSLNVSPRIFTTKW